MPILSLCLWLIIGIPRYPLQENLKCYIRVGIKREGKMLLLTGIPLIIGNLPIPFRSSSRLDFWTDVMVWEQGKGWWMEGGGEG